MNSNSIKFEFFKIIKTQTVRRPSRVAGQDVMVVSDEKYVAGYNVFVDGHLLGEVWKGWSRLGGAGWLHTGNHTKTYKSRKEAARRLYKSVTK